MNSKILISDNGRVRNSDDVQLVESVITLKNKGEHWAAIDALLKAWAKQTPDEVDALAIQINNYKEVLVDKKFGQTKDGKDLERRLTVSFPRKLLLMIRAIYKPDELVMDADWFREFTKRYPWFKVAEES